MALIVNVSFAFPGAQIPGLLKTILFTIVNRPAIGIWALSGSVIRRQLSTQKRLAIFNACMASLLVLSMIPMLFTA